VKLLLGMSLSVMLLGSGVVGGWMARGQVDGAVSQAKSSFSLGLWK
jgi:hypothetical protein